MLKIGNTVEFRVWDSMFGKWIAAIGVVKRRLIGELWIISAEKQPGLRDDFEAWVHVDNIIT